MKKQGHVAAENTCDVWLSSDKMVSLDKRKKFKKKTGVAAANRGAGRQTGWRHDSSLPGVTDLFWSNTPVNITARKQTNIKNFLTTNPKKQRTSAERESKGVISPKDQNCRARNAHDLVEEEDGTLRDIQNLVFDVSSLREPPSTWVENGKTRTSKSTEAHQPKHGNARTSGFKETATPSFFEELLMNKKFDTEDQLDIADSQSFDSDEPKFNSLFCSKFSLQETAANSFMSTPQCGSDESSCYAKYANGSEQESVDPWDIDSQSFEHEQQSVVEDSLPRCVMNESERTVSCKTDHLSKSLNLTQYVKNNGVSSHTKSIGKKRKLDELSQEDSSQGNSVDSCYSNDWLLTQRTNKNKQCQSCDYTEENEFQGSLVCPSSDLDSQEVDSECYSQTQWSDSEDS